MHGACDRAIVCAQRHRGRPRMRPASAHCGAGAHGSACGHRVRRERRNGAQSRCRCGRGEPSPGADSDVAAVGQVPAQMWQRWAQFGVTVARRSAQVHARRSARQEGRARRAPWAAEHIHRPSTGNAPRALPPQRCGAHARRDATSTGRNANAPQAAGVSGTRGPSPVSSMPVGRHQRTGRPAWVGTTERTTKRPRLALPVDAGSGGPSPAAGSFCQRPSQPHSQRALPGPGWQDAGCSLAAAHGL